VSHVPSPRGTFEKIANALEARIKDDPGLVELPLVHDLMERYGVSRGVVLRAFHTLRHRGLAEPVPGAPWRVVRRGDGVDRRPLTEKLLNLITAEDLQVGSPFPSASSLAERFGVSRPTVTKALGALEADGWLTGGGQGRRRTVNALPKDVERPS